MLEVVEKNLHAFCIPILSRCYFSATKVSTAFFSPIDEGLWRTLKVLSKTEKNFCPYGQSNLAFEQVFQIPLK
jgi:hypothetical protein